MTGNKIFKYQMAALLLKVFSLNSYTRGGYRCLGNSFGKTFRRVLSPSYLKRADWLVKTILPILPNDRDGKRRCLEVGTGWMHFYSIYLSMYIDFEGALFDVWDNRQLKPLKSNFCQVGEALLNGKDCSGPERRRIEETLQIVLESSNFDNLYQQLELQYHLDNNGSLATFQSNSYDCVFSMDVLEHVQEKLIAETIKEYFRVLKPGGYTVHQIGVDDHLAHYAKNASRKQYLHYSDAQWRWRFSNLVQYFNRVSYDEFKRYFVAAGFEIKKATVDREPEVIRHIGISKRFQNQDQESLEAVRVYIVCQKPYSSNFPV